MGGHQRSFIFSTICLLLLSIMACDVMGQGFSHFIGVPEGVPGVDYPNLTSIPRRTGFTCRDRKPGFYADPTTRCQAWHWCDTFLVKHSFICPNLTVFNQQIRACDWWYNVDCSLATSLYSNNDELYRDKDDEDYDENNNHLGSGNKDNRPLINVEVHTTTKTPQIINNINNGGLQPSETLHSRVALTGNDVNDITTSIPVNNFDSEFQSTPESFNVFSGFQQPTQKPPPSPVPTQPPTTTAPSTTKRPGNQLIILSPARLPNGFSFNVQNAIPIAFPTARPTGRFGPDPDPITTTNSPVTVSVPIQPVTAATRTPSEFARAENGGFLGQAFNQRRRLRGRSRFQKPHVSNTVSPLSSTTTTSAPVEIVTQPPTTSHFHFIAGNDPNFNFQPPSTTDNNFAIEQTTVDDFGNALNTDFNNVAFTTAQNENEEFPSTTFQQQDFSTTEAQFIQPTQTEDISLPVTNPPIPVRSPKLILLRDPIQQPQLSVATFTTTPKTLPSPIPQQQQTPFFNSGIPFGARLRTVSTTDANNNGLDHSAVFRRHDVFSTTTSPTTSAPQAINDKITANFTSPTTVIAASNASFRKRKLINGSNRVKNTFPPFPVTTFAPKVSTELQKEQTELPKRKIQTAATVWFKIFPSSTTPPTTTTTTTEQPVVTTTLSRKVTLRKKVPTTNVTKKRRTFPSFPITTFKPKIDLSRNKKDEFGAKDNKETVLLSTTEFDSTPDSTWPSISTTNSQ
ncbi:hypothetical protein CHUAL_006834 [Chamberlinius hualienensis]